jgi:hypothetical protein
MQLLPNPPQVTVEEEVKEKLEGLLTPMRQKRWYAEKKKQAMLRPSLVGQPDEREPLRIRKIHLT